MSNDFLSQDEIDALLRQGSVSESQSTDANLDLTEFERDALGEIGNISFGTAATALSTLLRHKVEITTPAVSIVQRNNLQNDLPLPHVVIKVDYADGFVGANVLAIKTNDAQVIADLMLGGDGAVTSDELNELHLSAVSEAMNQMMGSAATSMSTIFNMMVNITPPSVGVLTLDESHAMDLFPSDDVLVKISFRLIVGDLIDSNIMQLVPISFAKTMLAKLTGKTDAEETTEQTAAPSTLEVQPTSAPTAPAYEAPVPDPMAGYGMPQGQVAAGYGMPQAPAAYGAMPSYGVPPMQGGAPGYGSMNMAGQPGYPGPVNIQPAQFAPFETADSSVLAHGNLNLLLDIPLQVTVELGRTKKQIRDILELGPGAIIELDKLAGEPVDILVNNKLIAKGEVVVIDENFGVRVTDILAPAERIAKLQ